jgi:hypothetical protein
MKTRDILKISVVGVGIMLTSCTTSVKTATVDTARISRNGFIMAKPQVVDIVVEKRKIEGRAIIVNSEYGANAIIAAKNLAVIDAVKKGNADIIVQPIFEIESNVKNTTATVKGFAGKYTDFRDVTSADTMAFFIRRKLESYSSEVAVPTQAVSISKKLGL